MLFMQIGDIRERASFYSKILMVAEKYLVSEYALLSLIFMTKATKKAEMDAKKNALRAEDIAKGVFVLYVELSTNQQSIRQHVTIF